MQQAIITKMQNATNRYHKMQTIIAMISSKLPSSCFNTSLKSQFYRLHIFFHFDVLCIHYIRSIELYLTPELFVSNVKVDYVVPLLISVTFIIRYDRIVQNAMQINPFSLLKLFCIQFPVCKARRVTSQ